MSHSLIRGRHGNARGGLARCTAAAACAALGLAARPAALQWPSFRGDRAGGWIEVAPTPVSWDVDRGWNVRWSVTLPGRGHSSPVVSNGRLFVTTAVADEEQPTPTTLSGDMTSSADTAPRAWRVLCFESRTGRLLWERTARAGTPRARRHPLNSYATPTPAADGRHLVVWFGSEGLYCYDYDGHLLWSRDFGRLAAGYFADPQYQWGVGSSPVIFDGLVFLQADVDDGSFLAAFRVGDGEPVWRVRRDDLPSWSTPTVYGSGPNAELVVAAPSYVYGYDPYSGRELWRYYWGMDIVESTPVVSAARIFVSSGKGRRSPIVAIRPGFRGDITPTTDRPPDAIAWSRETGGPITTTLLLYRGLLYALADLGVLRCYDPIDGSLVYQHRVPGSFLSSPVATDGKLYLSSVDGDVLVVPAGRRFDLLARSPTADALFATPAVADGVIVFRGPSRLVAVGFPPVVAGSSGTP